jgi:hypothetical protein
MRGEREKGKWAAGALWAERKSRPAEGNRVAGEVVLKREEERVGGLGVCFFFKPFSKPFQTSNSFQSLNTFKTFQD